jgi:pyridinium-3,5-bisthiocarboxylic acid mononucleotide nickel chelatase
MKIAYLECFSGMSGDMFLGGLVDAGVSPELLTKMAADLNLGARLEISKVNRSGITATKVDVFVHGEKELPREEFFEGKEHGHGHEHEREHEHSHQEAHAHPQSSDLTISRTGVSAPHKHNHDHAQGRGLKEIKEIIAKAAISEHTKKTATAIFDALGAAEAKIHGVDIESVHFHEVGAVDAIVDIVGAAVGAEALGVDEIVCSPLNVGGGTVKCAHGEFPVPAPATVELLKGVPIYSSGIRKELVTPTGAAIVKILATRFAELPSMRIERSGYGAGSRDIAGHPNVVRMVVGEAARTEDLTTRTGIASQVSEHTTAETIMVLEANLDDLNPQVFGYVMDRLLEQGALDVFGMPVQMKKNRPGTLLTVLCRPADANKLTHLIFTETTTLGVRQRSEQRRVLSRRWVSVGTPWGDVRMKIASMNGTVTNYAPEYEDCRKIAERKQVPLKTVMQEAVQQYLKGSH